GVRFHCGRPRGLPILREPHPSAVSRAPFPCRKESSVSHPMPGSEPDLRWVRDVLGQLVRLRSDRPEDRLPIAAWVEKRLAALGGEISRHGAAHSPALLARFHGGRGVLFSGHLDTVPATGAWKTGPAEVRQGRLHGRGSTDMKGGVTALLWASAALAAEGVPFSLALTTDE